MDLWFDHAAILFLINDAYRRYGSEAISEVWNRQNCLYYILNTEANICKLLTVRKLTTSKYN